MAFTLEDFDKIWASTSPLTPYEFSDSNYQQGWNFIGATPPARQMWDFLQKQNDEKMQWLYNNKLSLSGGTMTGAIAGNPVTLTADDGNGHTKNFVANPDGTLTWGGSSVQTSATLIKENKETTYSLNANAAAEFSVSVAKSGYTILGIVGIRTYSTIAYPLQWWLENDSTAHAYIRTTSATSNGRLVFTILYAKI